MSCLNPAECFNCYEPERLIAVCPVLRKEEQSKNKRHCCGTDSGGVSNQHEHLTEDRWSKRMMISSFLFCRVFFFFFSLAGSEVDGVQITILRDGVKHSLVQHGVVPFSNQYYCAHDHSQSVHLGI